MKKIKYFLIIVTLFTISGSAFANGLSHASGMVRYIRTYGVIGNTSVDIDEAKTREYGGGVDLLFGERVYFFNIAGGVEIGYLHLYETEIEGKKERTDYVNSLVTGEIGVAYLFTIQTGFGPYFATGDIKETSFGIMFGVGFEIPIVNNVFFPLRCRIDWVFDDPKTRSVGFSSGITVHY